MNLSRSCLRLYCRNAAVMKPFLHCRLLSTSNIVLGHKNEQTAPRIMITGGLGQVGIGLATELRKKYGRDSVLLTDILRPSKQVLESGPFLFADILDFKALQRIIVDEGITWLINLSALLSAVSELNTPLSIRVNIDGFHNIIELSRQYNLRLFGPSSIASFGPTSPRNPTPDFCVQRPNTIYGVAKVHVELMGEYYHSKFGLDFRSLRIPCVISADTPPFAGTGVYASHVFHEALQKCQYECYLRKDTRLPMIYLDDLIHGIIGHMEAPNEKLLQRTYNLGGLSFTPEELFNEIQKYIPNLKITYKEDFRQKIADTWPQVIDDTNARQQWGWKNEYNVEKLVKVMLDGVKKYLAHSAKH